MVLAGKCNLKEKKERSGIRTHHLSIILKVEDKRKIKGEACGNRTHDLLGLFKEENKSKKKERLWGFDPTTL